MKTLIIALSLLTLNANASTEYKQYFQSNGKIVSAEEAITSSLKGSEVYRCQSVEAKVSKAGTSIGLKNVKRPSTKKLVNEARR